MRPLISAFKQDARYQDSKWVSFGGSYSGSLSAWIRLKYPHLVDAAVASSAPVQAQINFVNYLAVVRDSLGSECDAAIQAATNQIEALLQHRVGWKVLSKKFNLCDQLDGTNENDVANFVQTLAGNFEGVVQYNKDNRAFEGALGTNITIDTICSIMTDNSTSPIVRYASVNQLLLQTNSQKCTDYTYKNYIDSMTNVSWASGAAEGGRQWTYQTCVEFGFFQSSDLKDQPFGYRFPVSFFEQQCKDIFGENYNVALLEAGVNATNTNYGGFGIKVTKIVFPNGSIDPWHALGILDYGENDDDAFAIFINGTAHCADQYPDSENDPPQLRAARDQIFQFLSKVTSPDCAEQDLNL